MDPKVFFDIISGHRTPIAYEPKCGFDVEQLERLFPEEMHSYRRWEKMHQEFENGEEDNRKGKKRPTADGGGGTRKTNGERSDDSDDDNDDNEEASAPEEAGEGKGNETGHLPARLANFDARTERMKDVSRYLDFAEIRKGSFLALGVRGKKNFEEKLWDERRKSKTRESASRRGGSRYAATWERLPAGSIRFLHWVGFDVRSALPPPNDRTTRVLAFLGHDFVGKIVEKAIYLRCQCKRERTKNKLGGPSSSSKFQDDDFVLELEEGEQLEEEDIRRALDDTTVGSMSLYGGAAGEGAGSDDDRGENNPGRAAQLYFGPGFEDRLEMEMNQIVFRKKNESRLPEKERRIRREEDELFSELSKPPKVLDGILDVLGEDHGRTEEVAEGRRKERERIRERDAKIDADRIVADVSANGGTARKRRRRKKSL